MTKPLLAALIAPALTMALGCSDNRLSVQAAAATTAQSRIERGKYVVTIVGCSDCHTPMKMGPKGPEPDMARFLSGHPEQVGPLTGLQPQGPWVWAGAATNTAFAGPWGVSYAANLTPDQNTGLGIWTEDMFVKAIRTGRHMGVSREILPPMPWPAFRNASDEDLKSIYAYLRTVKPVANHVPDVQPRAVADRALTGASFAVIFITRTRSSQQETPMTAQTVDLHVNPSPPVGGATPLS